MTSLSASSLALTVKVPLMKEKAETALLGAALLRNRFTPHLLTDVRSACDDANREILQRNANCCAQHQRSNRLPFQMRRAGRRTLDKPRAPLPPSPTKSPGSGPRINLGVSPGKLPKEGPPSAYRILPTGRFPSCRPGHSC